MGQNNLFDALNSKRNNSLSKEDFISKIHNYNELSNHLSGLHYQIGEGGNFTVTGRVRVLWGVKCPIELQPQDERLGELPRLALKRNSLDESALSAACSGNQFHTFSARPSRRNLNRKKRQSIINGHLFDAETSVFTPSYATPTHVQVSSNHSAPEVVKLLLEKFKVLNNADQFCLGIVKETGETRILGDNDSPLLEKILLGYSSRDQIFIREKTEVREVSEEVANFMNLPEAILFGLLDKLQQEHNAEKRIIYKNFFLYKRALERNLKAQIGT